MRESASEFESRCGHCYTPAVTDGWLNEFAMAYPWVPWAFVCAGLAFMIYAVFVAERKPPK